MKKKLSFGCAINSPVNEWHLESLEELEEIKDSPISSVAQILTETGLITKMLRSTGRVDF